MVIGLDGYTHTPREYSHPPNIWWFPTSKLIMIQLRKLDSTPYTLESLVNNKSMNSLPKIRHQVHKYLGLWISLETKKDYGCSIIIVTHMPRSRVLGSSIKVKLTTKWWQYQPSTLISQGQLTCRLVVNSINLKLIRVFRDKLVMLFTELVRVCSLILMLVSRHSPTKTTNNWVIWLHLYSLIPSLLPLRAIPPHKMIQLEHKWVPTGM